MYLIRINAIISPDALSGAAVDEERTRSRRFLSGTVRELASDESRHARAAAVRLACSIDELCASSINTFPL